MITLQLSELRAAHAGHTLDGVSASVSGSRIALVGHWPVLWAVLSGRVQAPAPAFRIDGQEARAAVVLGDVGVADPELQPLPGLTVSEWIARALSLLGFPRRICQQRAQGVLQRLGLGQLGAYRADKLPAVSLHAARVALAAATEPKVVFVPPPAWTVETMALEGALYDQLTRSCDVVQACDPGQHPELFAASDQALLLDPSNARVAAPSELYRRGSAHYRLQVLSERAALVRQLQQSGVAVWNPDSQGELWLRLPEGSGVRLVLQCAAQTRAAVSHLSAVFSGSGAVEFTPGIAVDASRTGEAAVQSR